MIRPDGTSPTQLTDHPDSEFLATWSPDGKLVAFVVDLADSGHGTEIGTIRSDGTGRQILTESEGRCSMAPVWSPDGSRVAFSRTWGSSEDGFECYLGEHSLWMMGSDGSNLVELTPWEDVPYEQALDVDPAGYSWSPDGTRIVFSTEYGESVHVVVVETRAVATIAAGTRDTLHEPAWSPDGNLIAAAGGDGVWLLTPDDVTREIVESTGDLEVARTPVWSPDGLRLAFYGEWTEEASGSPPARRSGILVVDADGRGLTPLIDIPAECPWSAPVWAPDSAHVAFAITVADEDGHCREPRLYVARADGSTLVDLGGVGRWASVSWSP